MTGKDGRATMQTKGGKAVAQKEKLRVGLTGNQLKILAMIAMTCDHVGLQLLPRVVVLRVIGRLALPIYAYMIAEGCRHTRDRKRYLLRLAGLGLGCQMVYFVAMGSLYQCILVTFSLSVGLIWLTEAVRQDSRDTGNWWRLLGGVAGTFFLCEILPQWLPGTDFAIDYDFVGVLLPVLIYLGGNAGLVVGLVLLSLAYGGVQWACLGALPLLLCYNGTRGRAKLGRLFYWYYPAHLVLIYGIGLLL